MDSNFWFPTDVDLFCRPFLCRANSLDGWAYRGGAPPQDCMYTPTNSVENSLPSLSTTLAKGDLDVPVSPTHRWLGRFTFTFTPTHGSWLNLIEGFFSKLARSVLRHIRVSCKDELKERLIAFIGDINREPVVHTWRYKIDNAA